MFRFTPPLATQNSGSHAFDFEYGDAFAKPIEAFQPSFATILLSYNPEDDAALNTRQTIRLKQLSDYCRAVRQPFMFELRVPAKRIRPNLTVETISVIQDAGVEPDMWKVEGFDGREDGERVVTAAEREGRGAVGSSVLGRGADANEIVHWLRTAAAVPRFVGFAVERRNFWDAVTDFMEARGTGAEAVSGIHGWVAVSERETSAVTTPPSLVPRHITTASMPPAKPPRFHSILRDRAREPHRPRGHTN
jgi:myo-inositol catabolism protein IolC